MGHIDRVYKRALVLGVIVLFGAPLCAETWYFQDTTIQGTKGGAGTVTGYVNLDGSNWGPDTYIILTGPFGTFTDLGAQLQLD
jgi:hypothetical protein